MRAVSLGCRQLPSLCGLTWQKERKSSSWVSPLVRTLIPSCQVPTVMISSNPITFQSPGLQIPSLLGVRASTYELGWDGHTYSVHNKCYDCFLWPTDRTLLIVHFIVEQNSGTNSGNKYRTRRTTWCANLCVYAHCLFFYHWWTDNNHWYLYQLDLRWAFQYVSKMVGLMIW